MRTSSFLLTRVSQQLRPLKPTSPTIYPSTRKNSPASPIITHTSHLNHLRNMSVSQPAASSTEKSIVKDAHPFDRSHLEGLLIKRFFYAPAFEHYGGVAGLYDFGPPGSTLQSNILQEWRKHFIIEDEMSEIDTTVITLAEVLKTSGHVDKFTDWMTSDVKTGDIFRADHLVEAVLASRITADSKARGQTTEPADLANNKLAKKKKLKAELVQLPDETLARYHSILAQIDNYTGAQLGELIREEKIRSPDTGNELTEPVEFNLMFESQIGPTGQFKAYLRPETAQGHFVNFNRLLEFNNGRLPFASAQIGKSFRNEISPKQGLLRVREFTMAEIEHYVDPMDKRHDKFHEIENHKIKLLPRSVQAEGKSETIEMTIGEAIEKQIVDNHTLGYFLARIDLFLRKIGINPDRLRFRQHMDNEMAHYASDCWDAEIHSSYGWIECVGCADRSAYDLTVHSVRTGTKLVVREPLKEVIEIEKNVPMFDKKLFGPRFRQAAKVVEQTVLAFDEARLECLSKELETDGTSKIRASDGNEYELTKDILKIERKKFKETTREYTPNVIEPSFGIGRILYSLLEHCYWARAEDVNRGVLSLPPSIAPVKVLIVPLSGTEVFRPLIRSISKKLRNAGIASRVDDSNASIGKRYSRNDELGTPFGITVDFGSVKNGTVTLRERDSTKQVIGPIDEVIEIVREICLGDEEGKGWELASSKLEEYDGKQDID
ncbi:Glycine--tRNA ligase 1, mitochondrial [Puccinia graminis f. sp. tritici]|uniref:glycine--tRNA ligase n=1 Tax=Puccinia graminis f. sp. tritici TaxID=56615 RepID=A0A5B0PVD3_PUCGR|nr:Glycine--tRNA ligase 1, mitochondrial [Puccinia graminis f. sp. tritici]KAA1103979.1 Glycine--tRNA ligase 1, mitochondrial [Puccinia graminis f. sp. tritici]